MDANTRLTELGFRPQKELLYNQLLPYADKLDEESVEQLAVIKANLGKAIKLRDLKIGATHWTCQLGKYVRSAFDFNVYGVLMFGSFSMWM